MSVRSCRVTIQDLDGTSHTAEVTASSLFEAVAQGLSALRKNEWVEGIEERFGTVKVSVADVRVEHQVKIADFMKWLERPGRTPREITQRQKIRAILGMSVSKLCSRLAGMFRLSNVVCKSRRRARRNLDGCRIGRYYELLAGHCACSPSIWNF